MKLVPSETANFDENGKPVALFFNKIAYFQKLSTFCSNGKHFHEIAYLQKESIAVTLVSI